MPAASHRGTLLTVVTFPSDAGWPQQAWGDIPRQKEVTLGGCIPRLWSGAWGSAPHTDQNHTN